MPPAQRLAFILGSSAIMIHNANSFQNQQINEKLHSNINSDNFKDL